jgi:hypothetical protein
VSSPIGDSRQEKELSDLKEAAQYVMGPYVPREEGVEPKGLIERLDEAENRVRDLLLDTAKLAAAATLSMVKYHEPLFDLQKVAEDVDLSVMVKREDIVAAAEEVISKFDF